MQPLLDGGDLPNDKPSAGTALKKARVDGPVREVIYFIGYMPRFRKLSNLFYVEWPFQQRKFIPGSPVYDWYERGNRVWSEQEFVDVFKALYPTGRPSSYMDNNGDVASGILAKLVACIANKPGSPLARLRLRYLLQDESMTTQDVRDWTTKWVYSEDQDTERDALLEKLMLEKFAIPTYRDVLRQTKDAVLHERATRGTANRYTYLETPPSVERERKGCTRGGDVTGKLLMRVRSAILANQTEGASVEESAVLES